MTGRTYGQFALDGECGQVYRFEQAGDITPAECAGMIAGLHQMRGQPLEAASAPARGSEARQRAVLVADLQWHWGGFYRVMWQDSPAGYRAVRRDNGSAIWMPSAAQLYAEISEDYCACPVPPGGGILP